ncbi:hypothetical protein [Agromyces sp. NPDC058110]|uniref:hypothetical protein n=1 Tax=Agromyces sp. NPDC058110 TaxID=3346345 RepID=UPI0036D84F8E
MMKRVRGLLVGGVVLSVVLTMSACFRSSPEDGLRSVEQAVRDASPAFGEVYVESGKDGLSRYVYLELVMTGDELSADDLSAALTAAGRSVPDGYEFVRIVARDSGGEMLDLTAVVEETGVAGAVMLDDTYASIFVEALRDFAADR